MKSFKVLSKLLGYEFKNELLLRQSLTHSSYSKFENYERLEFLGDRVLGLIISNEIFRFYPEDREGDLAKKISYLVCKNTLVKIANHLKLEEFFFISKNIKKSSMDTIKANSLEAVIAAIYLDSNFSKTYRVVVELWKKFLNKIDLLAYDPKSKLQEWSLKQNNILPVYETVKKEGPDHNPKFTINVKINNYIYSTGIGKNKQDAEIMAAKKALKKIEKQN